MKGAIIGDIIGSRYEFDNTSDYDFELFGRGAITLTILFAPWLWLMPFCATWATPKPCARGAAATPTRGANTTVIFLIG